MNMFLFSLGPLYCPDGDSGADEEAEARVGSGNRASPPFAIHHRRRETEREKETHRKTETHRSNENRTDQQWTNKENPLGSV
jgi:hypothetical protein